MKLLTLLVVALLFVSLNYANSTAITTQSKMKVQTKTKTEKMKSMFELLEEYSGQRKAAKAIKKSKKHHNKTNITRPDPFIFVHDFKTLELVHRGWLRISNAQFKNFNKYNRLTLPDWTSHEVNTGRDYFLINEHYKKGSSDGNDPIGDQYFYFRLSKRNFFFGYTRDSVEIVSSIPVNELKNAIALKDFARTDTCFQVKDKRKRDWIMCAKTKDERNTWVCKIRELLRISDFTTCIKQLLKDDVPVVTQKILQPVIMIPYASPMCNENYNYNSLGADWECDCHEGREQSPIDLPPLEKATHSPLKPVFEYYEIEANKVETTNEGNIKAHDKLKIKLEDNAIRIKHPNLGELVTLDGSIYRAKEIVFHTPAEHQINGKRYDMEMQIIHYGETEGDIAKQAVLCFLFEKKPGVYNKFIDDIDFFNLPTQLTKEKELENNIYIPKVFYNSESDDVAIMKDFSFYTYQGSLTAPPCTERTIMYVASKPIPLGTTAIELFQEALRMPDLVSTKGDMVISTSIPYNARGLQKRHGRQIYYYNAQEECATGIKGKGRRFGHYEKVPKTLTQYYWVNNEMPSGLPGAMVVSRQEARFGGDMLNLLG